MMDDILPVSSDLGVEVASHISDGTLPDTSKIPWVSARPFVLVDKVYTSSGGVVSEESTPEPLNVVGHNPEVALAEVSYASGMTINLGNYESCKISVSVKLPCYLEELGGAYQAAKTFVDMRLSSEVAPIREAIGSRKA